MEDTPKWYDAHLEHYRQFAFVKGREEYEAMYRRSIEDPDGFWAEQARKYVYWDKPWDFVLRYDFEEASIQWFGGGKLNVSYNCLDRHLPALADKVAYYWEGDNPADTRRVTYAELHAMVNKLAAVLKSKGVSRATGSSSICPWWWNWPQPCWPAPGSGHSQRGFRGLQRRSPGQPHQ
jgi:acetyl-CoA synthetase